MVNIKAINMLLNKWYNDEIEYFYMEQGENDGESTTVWVAVQLVHGLQKMVEYCYDNDDPTQYGINVYDFDPTVFKNFFN